MLIKERFFEAFGKSAVEIMKMIQVGTTSTIRESGGMPQRGILISRTGALVKDIQEPTTEGIMDNMTVVLRKTLKLPYGYLVSQDSLLITEKQRKFFWYKYFQSTGWLKDMWAKMALFGKYIHGRGNVNVAIKNVDYASIIQRYIRMQFPDKRTEIIIGKGFEWR